MATPIQMPQPGNTVEECILVKWLHRKGEKVTAGEIIAEIETDKANFEIESPADGLLLETFFEEGALVPVLVNIGVIGDKGDDVEAFRPRIEAPSAAPAPAAPPPPAAQAAPAAQQIPATVAVQQPVVAPPPSAAGAFSPRARRFAQEHGFSPRNVKGTGTGGRVLEADLRELYERSPRVSPLARQMMEEGYRARGNGSGVDGMIRSADLTEPPVKMSGMRKTIARRMLESLTTTAQYTMHSSADATGLLSLRATLKKRSDALARVNINDLVMYCAVRALQEIPDLNAELIDGEVYRHSGIDLGFACDTPRGLVVPVVRDAHKLDLAELATRIHELSEQAVNGALSPDDMTGGTFTVSNLGNLGIEAFTPIVNPPQVAILGVDAIQLKPVRRNGAVEFVDRIGFSITCDHQVVDGAPGARFLKRLTEIVENVKTVAGVEVEEH